MSILIYWFLALAYFMTIHLAHVYGRGMALHTFYVFTQQTVQRVALLLLISFVVCIAAIGSGLVSKSFVLIALRHIEAMCVLYALISTLFYHLERNTRRRK